MTKKHRLLNRIKKLPRKRLFIGLTVLVAILIASGVYALQLVNKPSLKQAFKGSPTSWSIPVCTESTPDCNTLHSSSAQTSSSSTPVQSTTPTPTPNTPTSTSSTEPATTTSCDKNGAELALSQLTEGEDKEQNQYAAVPLEATTEDELSSNNTAIGMINIALNSDWQSYVSFMGALNCSVVTAAPTPYPLQSDPGNLPPS